MLAGMVAMVLSRVPRRMGCGQWTDLGGDSCGAKKGIADCGGWKYLGKDN